MHRAGVFLRAESDHRFVERVSSELGLVCRLCSSARLIRAEAGQSEQRQKEEERRQSYKPAASPLCRFHAAALALRLSAERKQRPIRQAGAGQGRGQE